MRTSSASSRSPAFAGSAVAGVDPRMMGIGPVPAVRKLLGRAGVSAADLDLAELNQAFASREPAVIHELGLDPRPVNVNGGAIAHRPSAGHERGALRHAPARAPPLRWAYGLATLCVGVGQGQAALFERS